MRRIVMCAGVWFAVAANAAPSSRAALVGQHRVPGTAGTSALICEYSGVRARFEILAQHESCAPFIEVQ